MWVHCIQVHAPHQMKYSCTHGQLEKQETEMRNGNEKRECMGICTKVAWKEKNLITQLSVHKQNQGWFGIHGSLIFFMSTSGGEDNSSIHSQCEIPYSGKFAQGANLRNYRGTTCFRENENRENNEPRRKLKTPLCA